MATFRVNLDSQLDKIEYIVERLASAARIPECGACTKSRIQCMRAELRASKVETEAAKT